MQIDTETLHRLAHLARLEISPADESRLLRDLSNMIAFVEKLKEVDTAGVEPLTGMAHEINSWRTDETGPHLSRTQGLQNSPTPDPVFFRVPKILDPPNT
jgi:aspartyl-tRNA(Asn)/glutamyl-tRNA(Gln) amidotransferase subunit C